MTARRRKRPTIGEVALAANVARSTVSRAFSQPERLTTETVERVLSVARRLGYTPNPVAQALSTGRSRNVALIVPDVANPFFPPLIRAAQRKAEEHEFCLFLGDSDEDPAREQQLLDRFSNQVEGIVIVSSRLPDEAIRASAARVPVVLVNRDVEAIPRVLIDSGEGVEAAVEHLHGLGHKRIAYVSGPTGSWSNAQRRLALRRAADRVGAKVTSVPAAKSTYDIGKKVVSKLLATDATACIAFDDLLAQGILAGLAEVGVNVPKDFSVVGCDDVLGSTTTPALTTVSNHCELTGEIAVTLLMDGLRTHAIRDARHVLGTHLVERSSTGPASNRT
ncbi:LacI family DNA-binding transcriptional regulator [Devosia sp. YIM 151766]|uniref:LacI family DNA-binding transcriptional regulator n=1 Tax=Devosia sp. YIM 151766 TaxID=3017325 RepID=UPI00255C4D5E|nr:LacI family DNA-binding transcriptional regulator [Devosia sp. YIM 151766]WIY52083.1 LacI family DNA-binding transcriptional regulator [Devosia sp. YIM 151766]